MEGAKSAMYAQAGRNRGWSAVSRPDEEAGIRPAPENAPSTVPEPIQEPIPILEPPVVELPDFMKPEEDCVSLAMAYVHMQKWQGLYELEQGFKTGSIFAELDLPFMGKGACKDE